MTIWFVSRHSGALEWAARHGIGYDRHAAQEVGAGDTVIGSLPVHLAAAVCAHSARYINLPLDLPASLRGRELDAATLEECAARIEEYRITN